MQNPVIQVGNVDGFRIQMDEVESDGKREQRERDELLTLERECATQGFRWKAEYAVRRPIWAVDDYLSDGAPALS